MQVLNNLIKELEKKEVMAKNDLEIFSSARQRVASSCCAVMRPRLHKLNQIKCIDRSALDKDLSVSQALGNKISLNESRDWELPRIIERFKHTNFLN